MEYTIPQYCFCCLYTLLQHCYSKNLFKTKYSCHNQARHPTRCKEQPFLQSPFLTLSFSSPFPAILLSFNLIIVFLVFLVGTYPLPLSVFTSLPNSSLQCIFITPPPCYLPLQNSPIKGQCFVELHSVFQSRPTCFISTPFFHTFCSSTMNTEVAYSSETLVCFYQTKWHYISVLMIIAVTDSQLTYTVLQFVKMRTIKISHCYYNYFI